ncbi:MAG: YraN family protein [Candidatus Buchananbacteria bacterium RIFCSPHIGHO2_01_FULL_39_14]|uniref:UPF0102 protein A2912_02570 n=2 Tax=Candidatus Buchananiibacteriota TaxID=1817903 RepID=A0A1G1YSQ2_9BACT|nr:MAG: YraN family protein [Candidatus Buchananbacteria bacterium RIFCSPHIGHO2_01_FULL_39_14]OGY48461.1 MAG: YraN family protein [Candidatus Buchananbacteria bacterium RIFCSPHIGHO2_02_FULL_39_17]OGY55299.1 MAG: YraN family protein [Candidatus Buchananbacteria bacterium RIFCSPLOWO2_01_FULL_40_23b]
MDRLSLGKIGEKYARHYLWWRGYKILTANYRKRFGEVDLICKKGRTVVFVEVKTRRGLAAGWPEEAVTPEKLEKIMAAGLSYLAESRRRSDWRIDVLSILVNDQNQPIEIKHFKDVN